MHPVCATVYFLGVSMQYCMRRAVDNDLYIVTHIHLDDGLQGDTWRNSIIFNPSVKYGSMTYWDAIAKPTAEAVRKANYRKREVYFAMQAEMGATLFYHPVAWRNMIDWVKNVISKDGTPPIKVKVGININWLVCTLYCMGHVLAACHAPHASSRSMMLRCSCLSMQEQSLWMSSRAGALQQLFSGTQEKLAKG
jgi:hypothetical protein